MVVVVMMGIDVVVVALVVGLLVLVRVVWMLLFLVFRVSGCYF